MTFLRTEDGAWGPANRNDFYFVTTNGFNLKTRLWRLRFNDVRNPSAGGTIEILINGEHSGSRRRCLTTSASTGAGVSFSRKTLAARPT